MDRELPRLSIRHATDAQPCTELAQRGGQTLQVLGAAVRHEVDVIRWPGGPVCLGAQPTDEDVVDAVALQGDEDAPRVKG